MPIVVNAWEPDESSGYYVKWSDPDQDITAFIHVTPELVKELCQHHRKHRKAPTNKLDACCDAMLDTTNQNHADIIELWRDGYEELVNDIKDLKERGLKHNTPHSEHIHIRQGMRPDACYLKDQRPDKFKKFIANKSEKTND